MPDHLQVVLKATAKPDHIPGVLKTTAKPDHLQVVLVATAKPLQAIPQKAAESGHYLEPLEAVTVEPDHIEINLLAARSAVPDRLPVVQNATAAQPDHQGVVLGATAVKPDHLPVVQAATATLPTYCYCRRLHGSFGRRQILSNQGHTRPQLWLSFPVFPIRLPN